jgi:hypothetical protein
VEFTFPEIRSVFPPRELRDPEAVDHVVGHQPDPDRLPRGDVDVVRGDDPELRILDLPPPLVAVNDHLEARGGGRGGQGLHVVEGDDPQDGQHDDGEHHAAPHHQVLGPRRGDAWVEVPPAPPGQDADQDHGPDEHDDGRGHREHEPPQAGDPV